MTTDSTGEPARTRPITPAERAELERIYRELPGAGRRWQAALWVAVGTFAACALVLFIGWTVVNAVSEGWLSKNAPSSLRWAMLGCVVLSLLLAAAWARRARSARARIREDLAGGRVLDESFEFDAAKRFQEPEHGGMFYCLRTRDRRVFVVFDQESQDLGVAGKDPLDSAFRPRERLRLVRTPGLRTVIVRESSGLILDAGPPLELTLPPGEWPEDEEFHDVPWDELEDRLSRRA
jgi:hypothetical protein